LSAALVAPKEASGTNTTGEIMTGRQLTLAR